MFLAGLLSNRFQPTLPARGATASAAWSSSRLRISTHAPRTGSDQSDCRIASCHADFNPRSPHGERHRTVMQKEGRRLRFQPTLPARGATFTERPAIRDVGFQPTLPARGATIAFYTVRKRFWYFNPRSPHGERHSYIYMPLLILYFNPRSPHGERHNVILAIFNLRFYFNPRSPHGERRLHFFFNIF